MFTVYVLAKSHLFYDAIYISCTYKFSRDVIFADDRIQWFYFRDHVINP